MLQIIGALILLIIGFVIIKALFKASLNILGVILGLSALIVDALPAITRRNRPQVGSYTHKALMLRERFLGSFSD